MAHQLSVLSLLTLQHRGNYRMSIYERENFGGQMHKLMDDCENIMDRYRMSCNVLDGHWLMYEQPRGRCMRPGEYRNFMNQGMNNMRFMSMRTSTTPTAKPADLLSPP